MAEQLFQLFLWCNIPVALLALVGSFNFRLWVIGDTELLKALGAIMGHLFFLQFWFGFIEPSLGREGQNWWLMVATYIAVVAVVTVRPTSKQSAWICGFCGIGIFLNFCFGIYRLMYGFDAGVDFGNWYASHLVAWANLFILAGWSIDNIGRHIGAWGRRSSDVVRNTAVSEGAKK